MESKEKNDESKPAIFALQRVRTPSLNSEESKSKAQKTAGRWTVAEHLTFVRGIGLHLSDVGIQRYERQWKTIEGLIPTRTSSQIRTHAQKFFMRLKQSRGIEETNLVEYIQSRKAEDFIGDNEKYAKLGTVEDFAKANHQSSSDDFIVGGKRGTSEGDAICHSGIRASKRDCPGNPSTDQASPFRPYVSFAPPKPDGTQKTSIQSRSSTDTGYNPIIQPEAGLVCQIIEENRRIGQTLSKAFADLTGYSQNVSRLLLRGNTGVSPEAAKFTEYLYSNGMKLQYLIQDVMASQSKNSSLIAYLLMIMQSDERKMSI